eukprot:6214177-Pleurochrysis_carterae.AAC.7
MRTTASLPRSPARVAFLIPRFERDWRLQVRQKRAPDESFTALAVSKRYIQGISNSAKNQDIWQNRLLPCRPRCIAASWRTQAEQLRTVSPDIAADELPRDARALDSPHSDSLHSLSVTGSRFLITLSTMQKHATISPQPSASRHQFGCKRATNEAQIFGKVRKFKI